MQSELANGYNRLTKESRKHGEGRDSEVMFTAQPTCDFIRTLAEGFCKLCNLHVTGTDFLFKQTLKLLQIIVSQGDAILHCRRLGAGASRLPQLINGLEVR